MRIKNKRLLILTGLALLGIGFTSCNANEVPTITTASASTTQAGPYTTVLPNTTTVAPTTQAPTTVSPTSTVPTVTTTTGTVTTISRTSTSTTGSVVETGDIVVSNVVGQQESAFVEFKTLENVDFNLYLSGSNGSRQKLGSNNYYLREISSTHSRIDILGLKIGEYSLQIVPVINNEEKTSKATTVNFVVDAYDRSGYAHFKYSEGVGAYNNDGTLKDNAVVIYVTDANKNDVELTVGNKTVKGIGNILNSAGQETTDPGHEGQCKKVSNGKTYYATANKNAGIIKDLSDNNIPLVVRFVGIVSDSGLYKTGTFSASSSSLIDGLTAYNTNDYGGSQGDNGHMARIKSGTNITLEGVGADAAIDGWGFHFMCESAYPQYGKNFEVRNLCFMNNPEDAIGMEGVQEGSVITAPVERCWVHHNTFLKPTISSPAESDKGDGDGSCDFKRGEYFTMSYCYFEYCHKTNLIGSSDSSLQYNISFHHNLWYNCGSRIPLLRQANVHFYNNYVYGNINDSSAKLSYISSLRANCYMYSENNYYEGCKQIFEKKTGTAKSYGNTYSQCFNTPNSFDVESRDTAVSSNCAYNGTSYENFDTNSSLFYYDSTAKKSDCYLTDAVTAREECIKYAGSQYRTVLNQATLKTTDLTYITKDMDSIDLSTTSSVTFGSAVKGVEFVAGKAKFKGDGVIFKLNGYATCTLSVSCSNSSSMAEGYLVRNDGTVCIIGSGTAVLTPGIYIVKSCTMDKETTFNSLTFEKYNSEEFAQEAINQYQQKYALLSAEKVEFTDAYYTLLKSAIDAYESIPADYQNKVDYSALESIISEYKATSVTNVEALINAIGTVNENSLEAITTANTSYDKLINQFSDAIVSNHDKLVAANEAYKSYAVGACINAINAIKEVTLESEGAIKLAFEAYNSLDEGNKALVTNYETLQAAIAKLESLKKIENVNSNIDTAFDFEAYQEVVLAYYDLTADEKKGIVDVVKLNNILVQYQIKLIDEIGTVSLDSKGEIENARYYYNLLTEDNKLLVTNYTTLEAAEASLKEIMDSAVVITFTGLTKSDGTENPSGGYPIYTFGFVTIECNLKSGETKDYNGTTYKDAIKVESQTHIKFTLANSKTITLVTDAANKKIRINGTEYVTDANEILTMELAAGDYDISKKDSMNLFAIILE